MNDSIINCALASDRILYYIHPLNGHHRDYIFVHPWSLTWNLKKAPRKRRSLLKTITFRFYVKLWGCISCFFSSPPAASTVNFFERGGQEDSPIDLPPHKFRHVILGPTGNQRIPLLLRTPQKSFLIFKNCTESRDGSTRNTHNDSTVWWIEAFFFWPSFGGRKTKMVSIHEFMQKIRTASYQLAQITVGVEWFRRTQGPNRGMKEKWI